MEWNGVCGGIELSRGREWDFLFGMAVTDAARLAGWARGMKKRSARSRAEALAERIIFMEAFDSTYA
jgi:hypothetical protein